MINFSKLWIMGIIMAFLSVSAVTAEESKDVENKSINSTIGKVKQFEDAGKYIYINLDQDGKDIWIATLRAFFKEPLAEGDEIEYMGGDIMRGFESKALSRTFDSIRFVTRIRSLKDEKLAESADDPHKEEKKTPAVQADMSVPAKGEIAKALNGKSIEELYLEKDELNNKEVTVKGRVMKISKNILTKTWLTLQDGTGSSPDNKVIAVTSGSAKKGEIIVVTGILKTDVNLGAGYSYKLLIDEAKLVQ